MNFSSLIFIFIFLPIFLLVYYCLPKRFKIYWLLIGSVLFYAYSGIFNLCLLLTISTTNYLMVLLCKKNKKQLGFTILAFANIAALLFFKYNHNLLFPLGISFYIFNNVSYILDVRKNNQLAPKNYFDFLLYSMCFCHVTMGPLLSYADFKNGFYKYKFADITSGFKRFLTGLFKKVLFADNLGILYATLRNDSSSVLILILTLIVFAFQLYLDFSGYCDMVLGLGKMIGIKYPENFDYPYAALSISDFWRKWHITLSNFFKKYIYFPLGGNRVSKKRHIFNLLVVWFLTGMWHGNTWNFLLWGLYYGLIIIFEKYILKSCLEKMPNFIRHIYVICIVLVGYVFFSISSYSEIALFFKNVFTLPFINNNTFFYLFDNVVLLIVSAFLCFKVPKKLVVLYEKSNFLKILEVILYVTLFIICLSYILSGAYQPFLYNNF